MRPTHKQLFVALALATVTMAVIPAQARTIIISKRYEASTSYLSSAGRSDPTCGVGDSSCKVASDGKFDAGKVKFDPLGGKRAKRTVGLKIVDDVDPAGQLSVTACEDSDNSGSCASTDRIWVKMCIKNGTKFSLYGVDKTKAVLVTLHAVWGCSTAAASITSGQGMTTTGTVLLSYAR